MNEIEEPNLEQTARENITRFFDNIMNEIEEIEGVTAPEAFEIEVEAEELVAEETAPTRAEILMRESLHNNMEALNNVPLDEMLGHINYEHVESVRTVGFSAEEIAEIAGITPPISPIEVDPIMAATIASATITSNTAHVVIQPISTPINRPVPEVAPVEIPVVEVVKEVVKGLIPENSATILMNKTNARFTSALWYEQITREEVILAGLGGIGSYVAFLLARMNISELTLFDDDIVDIVNLSGQLYGINDIHNSKVYSMSAMIQNYANYNRVYAISEKYTSLSATGKVMICGFDNMSARKIFFANWLKLVMRVNPSDRKDYLFIDGRLAAEEYQILCLRGDDTYNIQRYQNEYLFNDSEATPTQCSYKQTTFMANQIASQMVNLFVNFVANKCDPIIDRYLPFYIEYNAEQMVFNTVS